MSALKPPALAQKYKLISDKETRILLLANDHDDHKDHKDQKDHHDGKKCDIPNCAQHNKCDHRDKKKDEKKVLKLKYADLESAITQAVYKYQFDFENFVSTVPGSAANTTALNVLLSDFSDDLRTFVVNTNGVPVAGPFTTKEQVSGFYQFIQSIVFQGFTLHTAPNVQVRPILNNPNSHASVSSGEIDYSKLNLGSGPLFYLSVGYYNFVYKYEDDDVFRIVEWRIDNRLQNQIENITLEPVPFRPYL